MRICPKCRTAYPARGRATCTKDGTRLIGAEEFAASQKDPLLGQTIAGRFHVIERIGTGGMGTVYRAEQAGLDRSVALKVLKRELISDRDTVARFEREAKAMSMLMHPNTVRVFDFGEDDGGNLFLAMELLEGELLTAWIEREVTPPVGEAVEAIRQILRSLSEAHSKAIIHRDLKPDNIFLARVEGSAAPVVKVLDFGIAKVFREELKIDQLETQAGTVFGTPRYMSPEQAQGNSLDHRSDLYSVGVLLYHLLTGQPPFMDDDAVVVMAKHIREAPEPPRKVQPDQPIPRRLEKALLCALAKTPNERFDNADAFEDELAACLPEVAREEARLARGGGPFDRLPRVPLAIGGAVVTMAVLAAVAIVMISGTDDVAVAADALPTTLPVQGPPREATATAPEAMGAPTPLPRTEVRLESEPAGAEIWDGERRVGATPYSFSLLPEQTERVTLRLSGHRPADVEVTAAAAPVQSVALTAERVVARPPPGRRRPSEESDPAAQGAGGDEPDPYGRFD